MTIVLDAINKSIEVKLAAAVTLYELPIAATYAMTTAAIFTPTGVDTETNGTTVVTAVAAPSAGERRLVTNLTIYNADTAAATVTVQLISGAATRILIKVVLDEGDMLMLNAHGWQVIDSTGALKGGASGTSTLTGSAIAKLSTTLNVDMQTAASTTLYTVPVGKIFVPVAVVVRDNSASLAGGTSYSLTNWRQTVDLSGMTVVGSRYRILETPDNTTYQMLGAGVAFQITVTTGSTAACTAAIDVFGYLV